MAVFASRKIVIPPPTPITVTITGSGSETRCCAVINGTNQYSAGTHEVNVGDTITFCVYGNRDPGWIEIDRTEVLSVVSGTVEYYVWTVPSGISSIEIALNYNSWPSYGRITVTTA